MYVYDIEVEKKSKKNFTLKILCDMFKRSKNKKKKKLRKLQTKTNSFGAKMIM